MRHSQLRLTGSLVVIFVAQSAASTLAQQPADPTIAQLHERVGTFFERVKTGSIKGAYDDLLSAGPLATREERESLEKETAKIKDLYGTYRGFDLVYTKRVGSDLVFVKYLYKCSKFPVLWHVTFYRSSSGSSEPVPDTSRTWQVVSIRFDTDLELLTLLKD